MGYRDIGIQDAFSCIDFTEFSAQVQYFIGNARVRPNEWENDETLVINFKEKPKDMQGAFRIAMNNLNWNQHAVKVILHVADTASLN